MDMGIKGRVALVTGAGRGMGGKICGTRAEEGAKVAVNDVMQERADAVAGEIRQAGGQAIGIVADVTDLEAVTAMVKRVSEEWGSLDILVNNAGIPVITGMPALLTRMSSDPHSSLTRFTMAVTASRSVTSATMPIACPPACLISLATASARSCITSFTATLAPSSASVRQICPPIPRPAPVTSATRPFIPISIYHLL